MRVLVTGGAGFIGSAVCRQLMRDHGAAVINVDKLTYAANLSSLAPIANDARYVFERVDICDRGALDAIFAKYMPTAVLHLAAESHVDSSITGAGEIIKTNVVGTYQLLAAAPVYYTLLMPRVRG